MRIDLGQLKPSQNEICLLGSWLSCLGPAATWGNTGVFSSRVVAQENWKWSPPFVANIEPIGWPSLSRTMPAAVTPDVDVRETDKEIIRRRLADWRRLLPHRPLLSRRWSPASETRTEYFDHRSSQVCAVHRAKYQRVLAAGAYRRVRSRLSTRGRPACRASKDPGA